MKLESRILLLVSLIITFSAGVFILLNHMGFAHRLMSYAYFIIIIAVFLYINEAKNES